MTKAHHEITDDIMGILHTANDNAENKIHRIAKCLKKRKLIKSNPVLVLKSEPMPKRYSDSEIVLLVKGKPQKGHIQYSKVVRGKTVNVKQKGDVSKPTKNAYVPSTVKVIPDKPKVWLPKIREELNSYDKRGEGKLPLRYPTPEAKPGSIQINPTILRVTNLKARALAEYKANGASELYHALVNTAYCKYTNAKTGAKINLYTQEAKDAKTAVLNSGSVENIETFKKIVNKMRKDFQADGVNTETGVISLMGLLTDELNFRIGTENLDGVGLTTMKQKHMTFKGDSVRFKFKGKSGVQWDKTLPAKGQKATPLQKEMIQSLKELQDGAASAETDNVFYWEYDDDETQTNYTNTISANDCNKHIKALAKGFGNNDPKLTWHRFRQNKANKIMQNFMTNLKTSGKLQEFNALPDDKDKFETVSDLFDSTVQAMADELNDEAATIKNNYVCPASQQEYWELFGYKWDDRMNRRIDPFKKKKKGA